MAASEASEKKEEKRGRERDERWDVDGVGVVWG
jgi:hypothetical protein